MRSNRLVSLYPVAMGQTQRPPKRGSWRGHSLAWGAEGIPPTELPPTVGGAEGSGHCSGCGGRSRLSQGGRGRSSPCARAKPAAKVHSGPSPPPTPPLCRWVQCQGELGCVGVLGYPSPCWGTLTTEEPLTRARRVGNPPGHAELPPPRSPSQLWEGASPRAGGGGQALPWGIRALLAQKEPFVREKKEPQSPS